MSKQLACVFDMDGTLIDSEPVYLEADTAFLSSYGIRYTESLREEFIGRSNLPFFSRLEELFPDNPLQKLSIGERVRLKDENYIEYARKQTRAFPEMLVLVDELYRRGVPLAVASGSAPQVIELCMRMTGFAPKFQAIVSNSEVALGKPEPDIFLLAARRIGARPRDCVVFEDSRFGLIAAHAAGMACVGVPTELPSGMPKDFEDAELLFRGGMKDFTAKAALKWLDGQAKTDA